MKKTFLFLAAALTSIAVQTFTFSSCSFSNSTTSSDDSQVTSYTSYQEDYQEEDRYSTQWKKFAGDTYRTSELVNNMRQNYAFSFNNSGHGKYIIFQTWPNSNIVEDQMEFEISTVSSDANYLYLHCYELESPIKIRIRGTSLYFANGSKRYEKWN